MGSPSHTVKGSNVTAVYTPRLQESLINGVCQGRKQFDPKGGSALCNTRMCRLFFQAVTALALPSLREMLCVESYQQLKGSEVLRHRTEVKQDVRDKALRGWVRNEGDHFDLAR